MSNRQEFDMLLYKNLMICYLQSLVITMISYMDDLRITFRSEKEFIDDEKLTSCMNKAFENIYKAFMEVSI